MSEAVAQTSDPAVAPKQDPETLVLRGRPPRVVRFRRGLVIAGAGLVSAALVAVTWTALEPPSFRMASERDGAEPKGRGTPDALANAPASYGDAPRLGPPLPGDLGRPILEHRRAVADANEAQPGSDPVAGAAERARAAAEAEQQRLSSLREAARASGVIVRLSSVPGGPGALNESLPAVQGEGGPSPRVPTATDQPEDGASTATGVSGPATSPPSSPSLTLSAGTVIPASLVTGLNSDLPGMVLAQVTEHVRDSATGTKVLIPQGSRLLGSYDSRVRFGQQRALLAWERIMLPDGTSIALDKVPATDAAGYAGVRDQVDGHTGRLLKGIALSTLLGVGTELSFGSSEGDLVRAVREATQQNAARAGEQIVQRQLEVQPTLRVRPGWPVRAVLHRDLALRPWQG
jgi:type IV secretion system protein TrbI